MFIYNKIKEGECKRERKGESIIMVFKVLYQESKNEVPVRERTKSLYIESDSEKDVRIALADRNLNIEFIQVVNNEHLEYEKQSENFKLESV